MIELFLSGTASAAELRLEPDLPEVLTLVLLRSATPSAAEILGATSAAEFLLEPDLDADPDSTASAAELRFEPDSDPGPDFTPDDPLGAGASAADPRASATDFRGSDFRGSV